MRRIITRYHIIFFFCTFAFLEKLDFRKFILPAMKYRGQTTRPGATYPALCEWCAAFLMSLILWTLKNPCKMPVFFCTKFTIGPFFFLSERSITIKNWSLINGFGKVVVMCFRLQHELAWKRAFHVLIPSTQMHAKHTCFYRSVPILTNWTYCFALLTVCSFSQYHQRPNIKRKNCVLSLYSMHRNVTFV